MAKKKAETRTTDGCYSDFIRSVLNGDDENLKTDLMKEFYTRTVGARDQYRLRYVKPGCTIVAESIYKPKEKVSFTCEGRRWKQGGPVVDATVADKLCVPVAYLQGIVDAVAMMAKADDDELDRMVVEGVDAELCRILKPTKRRGDSKRRSRIIKSLVRHANKQLTSDAFARKAMAVIDEALRRHNETVLHHKMPSIPSEMFTVAEVVGMSPFAGVYMEWSGVDCAYVGESCDVPRRLPQTIRTFLHLAPQSI